MSNTVEEEILYELQSIFDTDGITDQDGTALIDLESAKCAVEEAFKKQQLIGWCWVGYEGEDFFRRDKRDTQEGPSKEWLEAHGGSIAPLYGTPHRP